MAEWTGEEKGSEIGVHARTCPKCREVLEALSEDGTTAIGPRLPDDGATVAQTVAVSSDAPATWADSSQTVDRIFSETWAGETHDIASSTPDDTSATGADSSQTVDRIASGSSPEETLDLPSRTSATLEETEVAAPANRPRPGSSRTVDDQAATLDETAAPSDATTDFSREERPRTRKTLPGPFVAPGLGGENGPVDYEILAELGRGGMGIVYKAMHHRLNRLVALKMIRGGVHADDIQIIRFKIEAEAVAALRHPNILQIYEIGESNGLPYVALELLEGGSLADRLKGTALPPRKAAEWMVPLALAMDTAHRAGIVHRDLKSANILFTADEVPKITDFGLAKRLEMDDGHTHTGQVMGTPSYMAPEQARGDTKTVGPPADIYALGAMLYEMLTGRPPFKGTSAMETVKLVIDVEPVAPSRVQFRVPRDLETICLKCLQKEPRKRYATAKELAEDLNSYLFGEPIRARRTLPIERGIKWAKRRPAVATLLAIGILGVITGLSTGVWYWNHKRALERIAAEKVDQLKEETADDLIRAQDALSKHDLIEAKAVLTARQSLLQSENNHGLASLSTRTRQMLGDVEKALEADRARLAEQQAKDEVQKRYRLFLDRRKEALFRDTQFGGQMLPTNFDLTRKWAEQALGVFAQQGNEDDWTLGALPSTMSSEQQAEVGEGCYELLLVLAEAVATPHAKQVDRALRILESADRLRPNHSRAYHLRKASFLALKGDRAGEARELSEAQRVRLETAFDYFLSGQQEYKRHRWPDAIQDFEIALRKKPDHFWAQCMLANCYLRTSRAEAAKSCLTSCIQTDPDPALLYLLRGLASGQIGAKYLSLVKSSPGREGTVNASAEFEFEEAEADFHEALARLERTPDDELKYVVLVNRGRFRFQRGHLDQAAADYQEAIRLKKDLYLAHADLALVYQQQKKSPEAIKQLTRAIALKPDSAPLYRGRAGLVADLAASTPAQREAARSDLEMAILHEQDDNPVLAEDHTNRGKLLYLDGRLEDALKESKLALQVLPNYDDAHVLRIQVLLKLKRYDEAIRSCDVALATGKKSSLLYELRGLAHADHKNYPEAIRDYGRALELRPGDGQLLIYRGWAYLVYDSPKLALADFEAAIELDRANADAYNGRGTAHVRLGDHLGAVADAREALRLAKTNPRDTYNAARIHALAASSAAAEVGEKGRGARLLSSKYQDTAVQLIREAIEREAPEKRATFWRDTIQPDPALKAIRRRLKFDELIATSKQPNS